MPAGGGARAVSGTPTSSANPPMELRRSANTSSPGWNLVAVGPAASTRPAMPDPGGGGGTQRARDLGGQRLASQRLPVGPVEGDRPHLDQPLVVLGRGLLHVGEPKDVGRSISCVDHGL